MADPGGTARAPALRQAETSSRSSPRWASSSRGSRRRSLLHGGDPARRHRARPPPERVIFYPRIQSLGVLATARRSHPLPPTTTARNRMRRLYKPPESTTEVILQNSQEYFAMPCNVAGTLVEICQIAKHMCIASRDVVAS